MGRIPTLRAKVGPSEFHSPKPLVLAFSFCCTIRFSVSYFPAPKTVSVHTCCTGKHFHRLALSTARRPTASSSGCFRLHAVRPVDLVPTGILICRAATVFTAGSIFVITLPMTARRAARKAAGASSEKPRFGYRRLWVMLTTEERVNHKRVWRVYRDLGLSVKRTRRKRLQRALAATARAHRIVGRHIGSRNPLRMLTRCQPPKPAAIMSSANPIVYATSAPVCEVS